VLRKIADAAPDFPWGDPKTDVAALARLHGHPRWLADMWVAELGRETAGEVMAANNEAAPLYLAVNPFASTVESARAALRADGALPQPCPVFGCVEAGNASAAVHGSALREGFAVASDAAAQLVTQLVPVAAGQTIVEIGSGRGTKTLLLQARAIESGGPARIIAVDLYDFKARLLEERLARYGVPGVVTLVGDATDVSAIPGAPAAGTVDAVLIDAPCSGLGTLRRHPEKRWRVGPDDVEALGDLGLKLLSAASVLVRPKGFVVYSTCTIAERENGRVVRDFLASERGSGFRVDALTGDVPEAWRRYLTEEGFFSSVPLSGGPDGHFAARLVRA
jgi:16S rRNA (cytosine967-C5)-methyltransferase